MKTLNELAVEYNQKKEGAVLLEIYKKLEKTITEKAKFVFYQKKFRYGIKLVNTKQVDFEDIKQELYLEILRLLNNLDPKKSFETYLYSTLWNWDASRIINQDFYNQLKNVNMITADEADEEDTPIIDTIATLPKFDEEEEIEHLFTKLTSTEKKIIEILRLNSKIKQPELAKILKVTQQAVSKIFVSLRKKYKG